MRYLSVCSGIEAASRAWHRLGWQPVAFSEIEKFPCAYLAATYPGVPNLGDMTRFEEWPTLSIDGLVSGTPCQAFSVAGQRRSLEDERGNLTLVFCRIADRFDPEWIVWENVPGVLSTPDNAFGCFLAELAGCDTPIDPGRVGWTDAGVVAGPKRTCAWRVIDSQGFVPQRRSRVFVVATRAGSRLHPADVLFETEAEAFGLLGERAYSGPLFPLAEGVRGHHKTGREEGKDLAPSLAARTRGGGGLGTDAELDGALVTHALRADGFDASEDGTGRGTPLIASFRPDVLQYGEKTGPLDTDGSSIAIAIHENERAEITMSETAGSLKVGGGKPGQGYPAVAQGMVVRRLTPLECERLMGQPDNATLIEYRGKPAADGPRYKALGNSKVVDVVLWIGERIDSLSGD